MPKRRISISTPEILLDASLSAPLYRQVYERFRGAILAGQLEAGARLPSTRQLAIELGISRTTTALAYQQLLLEGYLESRVGQGTTVARQLPTMFLRGQTTQARAKQTASVERAPLPLATHVHALQHIPSTQHEERQAPALFRGGEPALDLFPYDLWARLLARRARQSLHTVATYQAAAGYLPLREAIAAHIGITRGVRCTPERIIITAGSQGALDLAARTLLNPGDAALLENPGYFGAQGALLAAHARIIPGPVDEQGLNVAIGRRRCPTARVMVVTPSHQFPTGVTMSLGRRLALLDWARQAGAWILEDDYDSLYRFSGRPLESLQGLDQAGRVLYIGSFSKTLFPALRLGYLVAPSELVAPLLASQRFIDVHSPILEQMALCDFLTEGHFARHALRTLHHYHRRRDQLYDALLTHLGGLLDVHLPEAGLHLVGWLPPGKDDRRAAALASRVGLDVMPISQYSLEPLPQGGLLFGYASTSEEHILPAVKRLATALGAL